MKKWICLAMIIPMAFAFAGCSSSKTAQGAGAGAAAGGVLGAIFGHQSDNRTEGAVVGAVAGGAIGAIIGNRMEKQAEDLETVEGMEDVSYDEESKQIDATMDILFEFDKAEIRSSEKTKLDDLADVFSEYPENIVVIEGHTDSKGSEAYNQRLSELRASRVAEYLRSKDLEISSLSSEGYGETRPVATNETAEGREKNRRVEIKITADPERVPTEASGDDRGRP